MTTATATNEAVKPMLVECWSGVLRNLIRVGRPTMHERDLVATTRSSSYAMSPHECKALMSAIGTYLFHVHNSSDERVPPPSTFTTGADHVFYDIELDSVKARHLVFDRLEWLVSHCMLSFGTAAALREAYGSGELASTTPAADHAVACLARLASKAIATTFRATDAESLATSLSAAYPNLSPNEQQRVTHVLERIIELLIM